MFGDALLLVIFLEFLGNGMWAFSNTQEDESINRNIGHGESWVAESG